MPDSRRPLLFSLALAVVAVSVTFLALSRLHVAASPAPRLGALELSDYVKTPNLTLVLPDQNYLTSLNDLGLTVDPTSLALTARAPEIVIPSQDHSAPRIVYDPTAGSLVPTSMPQDYVIKTSELIASLANELGQDTIILHPAFASRDRFSQSLADYNQKLARVFATPLNVSLKNGSSFTSIVLDPPTLRSLLVPPSTDPAVPLDIIRSRLLLIVTPQLTVKEKPYFNPDAFYTNTKTALNARFMDRPVPVVLGVDDGPTSNGSLAYKYLEIDLSQQKMYFFINYQLYKTYSVSTGDSYPTPVGDYHILNKAPKAFSSIYNVWMPYWMGFTYAKDVEAYLGIHEIAYAVDAKGKPFYKHGYYIGEMFTGGCIAMEPKDSHAIYDLSDVGMLVRIVK